MALNGMSGVKFDSTHAIPQSWRKITIQASNEHHWMHGDWQKGGYVTSLDLLAYPTSQELCGEVLLDVKNGVLIPSECPLRWSRHRRNLSFIRKESRNLGKEGQEGEEPGPEEFGSEPASFLIFVGAFTTLGCHIREVTIYGPSFDRRPQHPPSQAS